MRVVVADSSPLNVLVRIQRVDLLSRLFERVVLPTVVSAELSRPTTPSVVRDWIAAPPGWIEITGPRPMLVPEPEPDPRLDPGEVAAIRLALAIGTPYVLMDERDARAVARHIGLIPIGTLGVLAEAHDAGLSDLAGDIGLIRKTDFRVSVRLLNTELLKRGLPPL